jgi:hypothetical protein
MWSVGVGRLREPGDDIQPDTVIGYDLMKKEYSIDYIADPFLIKHSDTYYLFVEAAVNDFGKIAVFESSDLAYWKYKGIVLEEPEHMSYPQVFKIGDEYYMLPETKDAGRVSLYRSKDFPYNWEKVRDLISYGLLDVTVIFHHEKVYLFGVTGKYELHCFFSDNLLSGDFKEHPLSPLGKGEKMRPAGTPFVKNGRIIMPVQSRKKGYGYSVWSLIICELNTEIIRYRKGRRLLGPDNRSRYFKHGVHHLCLLKDKDRYVYAIDGRIGTGKPYWRNYRKTAITNFLNDLKFLFCSKTRC